MITQRPRAHDERGASAVEYALLLAAVAAVIITAVVLLGGTMAGLLDGTCDSIQQETAGGSC